MYSPERMCVAIFALGLIFCLNERISAEDKPPIPAALKKELRPAIEFTGKEAKEPFMDMISKIKETAVAVTEVPTESKPVVEEPPPQRPALPPLVIQGIIWGSSVPCVIIDSRVLKEGDLLGEVKIAKIGREGLELLYQGWNYTLPSPAAAVSLKSTEGGQ